MIFVAFIQQNLNYFCGYGIGEKQDIPSKCSCSKTHQRGKRPGAKFPSTYLYLPIPDDLNFFKKPPKPLFSLSKKGKKRIFLNQNQTDPKCPETQK